MKIPLRFVEAYRFRITLGSDVSRERREEILGELRRISERFCGILKGSEILIPKEEYSFSFIKALDEKMLRNVVIASGLGEISGEDLLRYAEMKLRKENRGRGIGSKVIRYCFKRIPGTDAISCWISESEIEDLDLWNSSGRDKSALKEEKGSCVYHPRFGIRRILDVSEEKTYVGYRNEVRRNFGLMSRLEGPELSKEDIGPGILLSNGEYTVAASVKKVRRRRWKLGEIRIPHGLVEAKGESLWVPEIEVITKDGTYSDANVALREMARPIEIPPARISISVPKEIRRDVEDLLSVWDLRPLRLEVNLWESEEFDSEIVLERNPRGSLERFLFYKVVREIERLGGCYAHLREPLRREILVGEWRGKRREIWGIDRKGRSVVAERLKADFFSGTSQGISEKEVKVFPIMAVEERGVVRMGDILAYKAMEGLDLAIYMKNPPEDLLEDIIKATAVNPWISSIRGLRIKLPKPLHLAIFEGPEKTLQRKFMKVAERIVI